MNLYFVVAKDENGENMDLFVSAPDYEVARELYRNWLKDNWEYEETDAIRTRVFEVPSVETAAILHWNEAVVEVYNGSAAMALNEVPYGPTFAISSHRCVTSISEINYRDALSQSGGGPSCGIFCF